MSEGYVWAVVIGMAAANYAVRLLPIAVLSQLELPRPVLRWLSFIPVSVMAALVVGEVARPGGTWLAPHVNPYLWAALATGAIYHRFRSFLGATLAGILSFLVFRALLG